MTGWAQTEMNAVVVKGTSGVVVLAGDLVDLGDERECVRCSKCVEVCPMFLMPNFIAQSTRREQWDKAEMWGALDCFECGCCSFSLPRLHPARAICPESQGRDSGLKEEEQLEEVKGYGN